jgi:hypothetical protein
VCGGNFSYVYNKCIFLKKEFFFFKFILVNVLFMFGENNCKQLGLEDVQNLNTLTNNLFEKKNLKINNFNLLKNGDSHNLVLSIGNSFF